MRTAARFIGLVAILATAATGVACRGASGDDDSMTPDGGGPGDDGGGGMTIYDVQNDAMAVGTEVELKGVVVTAIDPNSMGTVYVQDPMGGPFSGLALFRPSNIADVKIGDVVTVRGGVKDEFKYTPAMGTADDKSVTQLKAAQGGNIVLTKTGTATIEPEVVDAVALAASEDEAEKWEGVLIRFENVAVVQAPSTATTPEMRVTGPFRVAARIVPLAIGGTAIAKGDCFTQVTGVVNYFYDYKLLPRSEADFGVGGAACPAPENTAAVCGDALDNDHNGFADCADFGCQGVAGVNCTTDTSIVNIQNGTITKGTLVKLNHVVVTAVYKDPTANMSGVFDHMIWVQDGATAQFNGVAIFRPAFAAGTIDDIVPGAILDVEGKVDEFKRNTDTSGRTVTEIVSATITGTGTTAAVPTPLIVDLAVLADPVMAEPYEGVLVEVDNAKVVNADMGFGEWSVGTAAASIGVDDLMTPKPAPLAVGDCYTKVAGPLHYDNGHFSVQPRPGDLAAGATCQ